jgi:Uma2 family endonuclease
MSAALQLTTSITPTEYLLQERQALEKHEFVEGIIYAMAGASKEHCLITTNVSGELYLALKNRPCNIYSNDMRVKVNQNDYTYPDVVAVCGESKFEDQVFDTLLNPTVIIEVLSETTESYDRGKKAALYRGLESLQDYILIAQDHCYLEHYHRQNSTQWLLTIITSCHDSLGLTSIHVTLAVRDIYDKVILAEV